MKKTKLYLFGIFLFLFSSNTISGSEGANQIATFGSGCFWCTQKDFDQVEGVLSTTVGHMGGTKENPTYKEVSAGGTGHVEVAQIVYDPKKVSYQQLLAHYFRNVDYTDDQGQFCDRGDQYRPVIFYHSKGQRALAEDYIEKLKQSKNIDRFVVEVAPATTFYPAEEYHQKYYQKRPLRYRYYRYRCGRDKRLEELNDGN